MSKVAKFKVVKNPCKICMQTVKPKTGLQCMGACEAWVHYQCLNYTPGKIYDIKKGIIEVTCPCPDCDEGKPKGSESLQSVEEYRQTQHEKSVRPIPPAPKDSITECVGYEEFASQNKKVKGNQNQRVPNTLQPKTDEGIHFNYSPKSPVTDPNSENLVEQMMGTIGELSQKLQGLMKEIQKNPGFEKYGAVASNTYMAPTHSKEQNTVVEWTCSEPNTARPAPIVRQEPIGLQEPIVLPHQQMQNPSMLRVYDRQICQANNDVVVNNHCCYYPNRQQFFRQ